MNKNLVGLRVLRARRGQLSLKHRIQKMSIRCISAIRADANNRRISADGNVPASLFKRRRLKFADTAARRPSQSLELRHQYTQTISGDDNDTDVFLIFAGAVPMRYGQVLRIRITEQTILKRIRQQALGIAACSTRQTRFKPQTLRTSQQDDALIGRGPVARIRFTFASNLAIRPQQHPGSNRPGWPVLLNAKNKLCTHD